MTPLDQAIVRTLKYFDIFDLPLTATQLWRQLVMDPESVTRWSGQHAWHLAEVQAALATSPALQSAVGGRLGYYCLAGREELVARRLDRYCHAQDKWEIVQRAVRWLAAVPFVRMIAVSGSLAQNNTRPQSDLDLFIITRAGRIWTARLGLLIVAQLLGRRRKYWDEQAPDKICLNHYVTDATLLIDPAIRNLYTAVLYKSLVPLLGREMWQKFQHANAAWLKHYLMYREAPTLPRRQQVRPWRVLLRLKRQLELLLLEAPGAWLERVARRMQRRVSLRHAEPGRSGRIVLSDGELAFHPDSKVPHILTLFAQDVGQRQLL
jgi:hypothetical protein